MSTVEKNIYLSFFSLQIAIHYLLVTGFELSRRQTKIIYFSSLIYECLFIRSLVTSHDADSWIVTFSSDYHNNNYNCTACHFVKCL